MSLLRPDVSVVVVSWRVRELLRECLASVREAATAPRTALRPFDVEVIVVDNASGDGTPAMVRAEFPEVAVIANEQNRGFGAANNQALAVARGRYILFLNPDATLQGTALRELYDFLEEQPYVGIVGPRLENPDGTLQRSCRQFPTFWSAALILSKLHNIFPNLLPLRRYYLWAFEHRTLRQVDQLMGACLLVRRSVLDEVGVFDEQFFLWFEEVDLCRRVRDAGYLVFFFPEATVRHRRSSGFVQQRPLWRQRQFAQSLRRYFWKYHAPPVAALVTLLSFFSLVPALVIEGLLAVGLAPRKRPDL